MASGFIDRVLHGDNPDPHARRIRFCLLVGWIAIAVTIGAGRLIGLW
jgi:hypothetical protein